jgi:mono/diheme cytochrome c family protein
MLAAAGAAAAPQSAQDMQNVFEREARQSSRNFTGFSPQAGEQFFKSTHANDWSCASCHTPDPRNAGKHAKTGKEIAPLAPVTNPQRFTSVEKVEKWFKRNCGDVLGRACSVEEKGNVLAYLLSLE